MIQWMCERLSRSISNHFEWLNGLTKSNKFESVLCVCVFCWLSFSLSLYFTWLYILNSNEKRANDSNRQASSQPVNHSFQSICLHAVTHTNHRLEIKIRILVVVVVVSLPIKTDHVTVFHLSSNSSIYLYILFWDWWSERVEEQGGIEQCRNIYIFMLSKIDVCSSERVCDLWSCFLMIQVRCYRFVRKNMWISKKKLNARTLAFIVYARWKQITKINISSCAWELYLATKFSLSISFSLSLSLSTINILNNVGQNRQQKILCSNLGKNFVVCCGCT